MIIICLTMTSRGAISLGEDPSEDSTICEIRNRIRRSSLSNTGVSHGIRHRPAIRLHNNNNTRRNSTQSSLISASLQCSSSIVQVKYQQRRSSLTLAHQNLTKKIKSLERYLYIPFLFDIIPEIMVRNSNDISKHN